MESATSCGMELARSAVWNHHEVMYGINPKENARWRVMPYAYGDSILTCGEITYQSFGLDKKRTKHPLRSFLRLMTALDDINSSIGIVRHNDLVRNLFGHYAESIMPVYAFANSRYGTELSAINGFCTVCFPKPNPPIAESRPYLPQN